MKNKPWLNNSAIFVCLSVCFFSFIPLSFGEEADKFPPQMEKSVKSTLPVTFGNEVKCNAVRVSEDLALSAAHCLLGYDGKKNKHVSSPINGVVEKDQYRMKVIEVGQFEPPSGKMEDWLLLAPEEGYVFPSSLLIASFPEREQIERLKFGNIGGRKGTAIWAISYPDGHVIRTYPRKSYLGNGPFLSRGHLIYDISYKKYVIFTNTKSQLCDEGKAACPLHEVDLEKWEYFKESRLFKLYVKYEENGDPVFYHTADYSNGSSGGGIFLEESGDYLGLIPYGATPVSRQSAYNGTGLVYRVDVICKQSKILSKLEKCMRLIK